MTVEDIALTLQPGLGPKGTAHLLSVMGTAQAIYASSEEELVERSGLRRDIARSIAVKTVHRQAENELKYMRRHGIVAVASTDPDYPALLAQCADYPHVLYCLGEPAVFHGRMLAVVGTRAATAYGQRMCDILVGRLAEICPDAVVVSGLAYGIDACAHRAAVRSGLATVGVIANRLPDISPSPHRELASEMIRHGAVVTELHSQTRQNGSFFIPRNRIIAGMAEGTVVVESPSGGGSLSTAHLADGYGRTVMAVPGRAGDRCSAGANRLIVERRAAMVCSAEDIMHELGWDIAVPGIVPDRPPAVPSLNPDEKSIVACLHRSGQAGFDDLAVGTGIPAGQLSALLLGMELGGVVRQLPGKIYELV